MAVDFSKSKTRENFNAGICRKVRQNRYTIAAKQASRDNLYSISQIFIYCGTHAEVFYELLRESDRADD